jgi:transcriptional regulator with XRE-family HTH domain
MDGKTPGDADRIVSANILERRKTIGLSQQALGDLLGVTFQQVQKYENGRNRIPAGRLWEIAKALETSIEALYRGMPELVRTRTQVAGYALAEEPARFEAFNQQAVSALVNFLEIPEGPDRKKALDFIRSCTRSPAKPSPAKAPKDR